MELMKGDGKFFPLWNNCGGYDDYASDIVYWRLWPKSLRERMESQGQIRDERLIFFGALALFPYTFQ